MQTYGLSRRFSRLERPRWFKKTKTKQKLSMNLVPRLNPPVMSVVFLYVIRFGGAWDIGAPFNNPQQITSWSVQEKYLLCQQCLKLQGCDQCSSFSTDRPAILSSSGLWSRLVSKLSASFRYFPDSGLIKLPWVEQLPNKIGWVT